VGIDIRVAACIQNLGGAGVAAVLFAAVGTDHWDNTPALWGALAWAVLVASVIGTTLQIVGEQLAEACDLRTD
jgi:drug/metabolite transporter (DMT)-like permease